MFGWPLTNVTLVRYLAKQRFSAVPPRFFSILKNQTLGLLYGSMWLAAKGTLACLLLEHVAAFAEGD